MRPLRILLLASVFPALSETFVLDQTVALLGFGHDVRIVAFGRRDDGAVHDDVARHELDRRTVYLAIPKGRRRRTSAAIGAVIRRGPRFGLALLAGRRARHRSRETGDLSSVIAAAAAFASGPKPDIVVAHFGPNGTLAARALAALGWTVPVATAFHGYDISSLVAERGPGVYAELFRRGALFLPACEHHASLLRALGCPSDRTRVQRMCVDIGAIDQIVAAIRAVPDHSVVTFVSVGRLVPKKGMVRLVRAFAVATRNANTALRLRIVGDGPLRPLIERVAHEAGVADYVDLPGAMARDDVIATVMNADVVVQASETSPDGDVEGSPVVISEAMCLGKPVIATRHGGIPELVDDGRTGLLVDEGDETALASAMVALAGDPARAAALGQAGRSRLEREFAAVEWNRALDARLHAAVRRSVP